MQFLQEQKTAPEVASTFVLKIGFSGNVFIEAFHEPADIAEAFAPGFDNVINHCELSTGCKR